MVSLSYIDAASLWLGTTGDCVQLFLSLLVTQNVVNQNFCSRYALEIINNMCVHHTVRRQLLDINGIDQIVNLLAHEDIQVQDLALQILEMLEDVTPPEVMARAKKGIGLERMVTLVTSEDPLVRAVAVESIGEEVWRDVKKQQVVNKLGGIDSLVSICDNPREPLTSVLPALWSLRNVLYKNYEGQNQFRDCDGCSAVVRILKRCIEGEFADQSDKVLESALSCLVSAIQDHEFNSRRLLRVGLEVLMDLAELNLAKPLGLDKLAKLGIESPSVVALSKSLLSMLAPYNYVVCKNCHKRQNLSGTHCIMCGYMFYVDMAMEKQDLSILASNNKSRVKKASDLNPLSETAASILRKARANNILSSPIRTGDMHGSSASNSSTSKKSKHG
jgi:hypothetical protein